MHKSLSRAKCSTYRLHLTGHICHFMLIYGKEIFPRSVAVVFEIFSVYVTGLIY